MVAPGLQGSDLNVLKLGSALSGDQTAGFSRKQTKRNIPGGNGENARIIDEGEFRTARI